MMAFRSSAGISSVDMYRLKILKANSAYDRSFQLGLRQRLALALMYIISCRFQSDRKCLKREYSCKMFDRREYIPNLLQTGLPQARKDHRLQRVPSAQQSQTK